VAADTLDLDGDGNTTEPIPFDLAGRPRFTDDPYAIDTGEGTPPIVDMGAYERLFIPGDLNGDEDVDGRLEGSDDLDIFLACMTGPAIDYAGGVPADCTLTINGGLIPADLDRDGDVDQDDFGMVQRCLSGENQPADPHCAD
jgi:hypothetical protein